MLLPDTCRLNHTKLARWDDDIPFGNLSGLNTMNQSRVVDLTYSGVTVRVLVVMFAGAVI